ncbi:MAG: hypothetical protein KAJ19_26065 [Gammaproteobacteria bacterium]|nr:hypothetical protein [Gammaproteobacteria bacterium]
MSAQPFENRYCPCCLGPVDPVSGDHWHYCEYEASYGDWVNSEQPLTEIEMLERKLLLTKKKLKSGRKLEREITKRVIAIEAKIKAYAELGN